MQNVELTTTSKLGFSWLPNLYVLFLLLATSTGGSGMLRYSDGSGERCRKRADSPGRGGTRPPTCLASQVPPIAVPTVCSPSNAHAHAHMTQSHARCRPNSVESYEVQVLPQGTSSWVAPTVVAVPSAQQGSRLSQAAGLSPVAQSNGHIRGVVCDPMCTAQMLQLAPGTGYTVMMRAIDQAGIPSDWHTAAAPWFTSSAWKPGRPTSPSLLATTSSSLVWGVQQAAAGISAEHLNSSYVQLQVVASHVAATAVNDTSGHVQLVPAQRSAAGGVEPVAKLAADGLSPYTLYVARHRAWSGGQAGPWSGWSQPARTDAGAPGPPSMLANPVASSASSLTVAWRPAAARGVPVLSYDVHIRSYAQGGWTPWRIAASQAPSGWTGGRAETQRLALVATSREPISAGQFRLAYWASGSARTSLSSQLHTPLLAWNASAGEVELALAALPGVAPVAVHRLGPSAMGEYQWVVRFDVHSDDGRASTGVFREGLALISMDTSHAQASGVSMTGAVSRLQAGAAAAELVPGQQATWEITGLEPATLYQVRARARSARGLGDWCAAPLQARTTAGAVDLQSNLAMYGVLVADQLPTFFMDRPWPAGVAVYPGAQAQPSLGAGTALHDAHYLAGTALGGVAGARGGHGLVVLLPATSAGMLPPVPFAFNGDSSGQEYSVPAPAPGTPAIERITVKAWGGGGGAGFASIDEAAVPIPAFNQSQLSHGGAAAAVVATLVANPGDTLIVQVGGGGGAGTGAAAGLAGSGGGGPGGFAAGDSQGGGGGGGGGASAVYYRSAGSGLTRTVLIAAGGGGGGATQYCCAHGGAGAGSENTQAATFTGLAPHVDTVEPAAVVEARGEDPWAWQRRAPMGNYSVLATAGLAGQLGAPGAAGLQSSFTASPNARHAPSSGRFAAGGGGGEGWRGGGGGGGGLYGGGGGGAGLDAAGGGGGSSYVDLTYVWRGLPVAPRPAPPSVAHASHAAAALQWQPVVWPSALIMGAARRAMAQERGASLYTMPSTGYELHIAPGLHTSDWQLACITGAADAPACLLDGLQPGAVYRAKVLAMYEEKHTAFSNVLTFVTADPPTQSNVWSQVTTRRDSPADIRGGSALPNLPTDTVQERPATLAGASMTQVAGRALLFGGASRGYTCSYALTTECIYSAGLSSTVWVFDPVLLGWEQLQPSAPLGAPQPRYQHAAAATADEHTMLVHGGVGYYGQVYNDVWALRLPEPRVLHVNGSTVAADGQDVSTSVLEQPSFVHHALPAAVPARSADEAAAAQHAVASIAAAAGATPATNFSAAQAIWEMARQGVHEECVADVEVWVQLEHDCLQDVEIVLEGPGPAWRRDPARSTELGGGAGLHSGPAQRVVLFQGGQGSGSASSTFQCGSNERGAGDVQADQLRSRVPTAQVSGQPGSQAFPPRYEQVAQEDPRSRAGWAHAGTDAPHESRRILWFKDNALQHNQACCQDASQWNATHAQAWGAGLAGLPLDALGLTTHAQFEGEFTPLQPLASFVGMPAHATWQLLIADRVKNGATGAVKAWGLRVFTTACKSQPMWLPRPPAPASAAPPARHTIGHALVDGSWFVWGGAAQSQHRSLWRFDVDSSAWSPVAPDVDPMDSTSLLLNPPVGRAGVMTPFGVLTVGGRPSAARGMPPTQVWQFRPWAGTWHPVPPLQGNDSTASASGSALEAEERAVMLEFGLPEPTLAKQMPDGGYSSTPALGALSTDVAYDPAFSIEAWMQQAGLREEQSALLPSRRAFTALSVQGVAGTASRLRGVSQQALILYGGLDGVAALNDLWALPLRQVPMPEPTDPAWQLLVGIQAANPHALAQALRDTGAGLAEADGHGLPRGVALRAQVHSLRRTLAQLARNSSAVAPAAVQQASTEAAQRVLSIAAGLASTAPSAAGAEATEPAGGWVAEALWQQHCAGRIRAGTAAHQSWRRQCLAFLPGDAVRASCTPEAVLQQAWCMRVYNSIGYI